MNLESPVDTEVEEKPDNVTLMPPSDSMSPEQALAAAARRPLKSVVIVAEHEDGDLVVMSSKMNREFALWLVEHAKLHVMDLL